VAMLHPSLVMFIELEELPKLGHSLRLTKPW